MPTRKSLIVAVASAILVLSCTGTTPSNPPFPLTPSPSLVPPPPPMPPADVWNIVVRTTAMDGGGCVGQAMRAHFGESQTYTLSVMPGTPYTAVNIRSAAGDFDCTLPALTTPDGFTSRGVQTYFTCRAGDEPTVQCGDGTQHSLFSDGQDITGHMSGDHIVGQWWVDWNIDFFGDNLHVENAFTGSR